MAILRIHNSIKMIGSKSGIEGIGNQSFDITLDPAIVPQPGMKNVAPFPSATILWNSIASGDPGWVWMRNIDDTLNIKYGYLYAILDLKVIGLLKPGEIASFRLDPSSAPSTYFAAAGIGGTAKLQCLVWEEM